MAVTSALDAQGIIDKYKISSDELNTIVKDNQQFGFDNANQTVNTLNAGVSAFGSISSALVGFKSIELAEEELDLKKDQYKTAQQEFDRVAKVKSSLARRF